VLPTPAAVAASSSANGIGVPTASNAPVVRESAASSNHVARSRTSMTWTTSSGRPGASTSPPRASRCGQ
jgi:hypothetical protein